MSWAHIHLALNPSAVLVAGVIVAGMMGWIANLGGQIRHSEIRANGGAAIEGGARDRDH